LNKALKLDPDLALAHGTFARVYAFRDLDFPRAMQTMDGARENSPFAESFRGLLHFLSGNYEYALTYYQRALRLNPLWQMAELDIARAYERMGKIALARERYEAVLARAELVEGPVIEMPLLHFLDHDLDRARQFLSEIDDPKLVPEWAEPIVDLTAL
jgi:tetratricopeptide (TPR) repeat protein